MKNLEPLISIVGSAMTVLQAKSAHATNNLPSIEAFLFCYDIPNAANVLERALVRRIECSKNRNINERERKKVRDSRKRAGA